MKILIITGSYPPDICGVGDYTSCLMEASNSSWMIFKSNDWRIFTLIKKIRFINNSHCSKIVMQYPTQGYGWSLVPHLLCLYYSWFSRKEFIVVLHEFSQRYLKSKISTFLLLFANKIIFTNNFELSYAAKFFPGIMNKSSVIKILPNIPKSSTINNWDQRCYDLCYFGHIRPNKGLETFFDTASKVKNMCKDNLRILVLGQVLPEYMSYFKKLQNDYLYLNVDYHLNQAAEDVSSDLNKVKVTYLPFPDGLSERRGSFLAALFNGSIVVSHKGKFLTNGLINAAIITDKEHSSEDISCILNNWNDRNYAQYQRDSVAKYISSIPANWNEVVFQYEKFIYL